jgi:type VI protein secretion system component Hcp
MANEPTDVLMTFILSSGGVPAECTAVWDSSDTAMHQDFVAGCYFELDDFSLGGGLESEDSKSDKTTTTDTGGNKVRTREPANNTANDKEKKSSRGNKFAKYILEGSLKYPLDVQEISISRRMDKASPILLNNCLTLTPFTKAVIVKRKVVGGVSEDNLVHHRGFLRLDFDKPLITSVEWEDGEVVKEKLKFICRGFKVTYRPQNNDGTLGSEVPMNWKPSSRLAGSGNGPG